MAADKKIRDLVESFVAELTVLAHEAAIEQVQAALTSAAPKRGPGRPRGSGSKKAGTHKRAVSRKKKGKRILRSSAAVDSVAADVLAFVKSHDGAAMTEIAAALGSTSKDLRLPVLKLLGDKALRTTGQRRGTRYHAGGRGAAKKTSRKKSAKKKSARRKN
jgi:hypothetical protein